MAKGITIKQVKQAISALEGRGDSVSMISIRQELGNSGSMSTIQRHLAEIRETGKISKIQDTVDVPGDLKDLVAELLSSTWRKACEIASADVEAIRKSAHEQVVAMEKDLRDVTEGMKVLDTELQQCQESLSLSLDQASKLETEKVRIEARLMEAKTSHEDQIRRFDRYIEQLERALQSIRSSGKFEGTEEK